MPPQHTNITTNVTARDIIDSVVGGGNRANIRHYTANDLAEIRTLVSAMDSHRRDLVLTLQKSVQFDAHLKAVREELRAHAPNHSRLYGLLLSLRHIAEAGAAHLLVGHWSEIMHTLQRLTGS